MQNERYEYQVDGLHGIVSRILGSSNVKTVFDIGARDSVESVALSRRYPASTVYSFECNPETIPRCKKNISESETGSRIHLIESAMSDEDGEISFYPIDKDKTKTNWADGNPGASSLLQASGKYIVEKYAQKKITVPTSTVSTFCTKKNITSIDLIWMDVQGAELKVLQGARGMLPSVSIIHTEVEFFEIYKGQPKLFDIYKYLRKQGFYLYKATDVGPFAGDMIFVNKALFTSSFKRFMLAFKSLYILSQSYLLSALKRLKFNLFHKAKYA